MVYVGVGVDVLAVVGVSVDVAGTVVDVPAVLLVVVLGAVVVLGGVKVLAVLLEGSDAVGVGAVVDRGGKDPVLIVDEGRAVVLLVVALVGMHSGMLGMQQTLIS